MLTLPPQACRLPTFSATAVPTTRFAAHCPFCILALRPTLLVTFAFRILRPLAIFRMGVVPMGLLCVSSAFLPCPFGFVYFWSAFIAGHGSLLPPQCTGSFFAFLWPTVFFFQFFYTGRSSPLCVLSSFCRFCVSALFLYGLSCPRHFPHRSFFSLRFLFLQLYFLAGRPFPSPIKNDALLVAFLVVQFFFGPPYITPPPYLRAL